jgi:hypothetical protein
MHISRVLVRGVREQEQEEEDEGRSKTETNPETHDTAQTAILGFLRLKATLKGHATGLDLNQIKVILLFANSYIQFLRKIKNTNALVI